MRLFYILFMLAACAAFSQSIQPGLIATYSDGKTRVVMITAAPQFYLNPGDSVHPSVKPAFEAEWRGLISIVQAGEYTFEPGAAQVTINGRPIGRGPVQLGAGRHSVIVQYRRTPGTAVMRLQWKSAKFPLEPVPGSIFFHDKANEPDLRVEEGRMLAEELGCVNCHRSGSQSLKGRMGPDLTAIGSRVNPSWLNKWLEDPQAFRPGAVMPGLADAQRRLAVTSYLASLRAPAGSQRARRIRAGDVGAGGSLFGSIGCAACHQQGGLSLDGMGSKTPPAVLAEYLKNPAKTDPSGRMPSLMLTDDESNQLAAYLTDSHNTQFEQRVSEGDAVRGKMLVESEGCLACHALQDGANRQTARPLDQLTAGAGCLADQPSADVPHYRMTADQRSALTAFLTWYKSHPDVSPAPIHSLRTKMRQFRCVACHELDGFPPTAVVSEATPPLTGVGEKLRTSWLEQVLTKRARARHWQTLRMPDYDPRHALSMAAAFAQSAGVPPGDGQPSPRATTEQQSRGAGLIGTDPRAKGMACIGCHDWGSNKSLGEEGPQLINVTQRLRYDWYHRWMLNPARILSGTSMPDYFSSIDRASANQTIDTLWAAMSLGERMPLPAGLGKQDASGDPEAMPVPGKRAIVVRWDMPEATPAAIAVGLPGKLSYCFDAGESRMRYAWRGGFIDLSETLRKKTDEKKMTPTAKLIGEVFYRSQTYPIRVGTPDRVPDRRFRGYRLVDGYPEFHYEVDGIEVKERIVPSKDNSGMDRMFTVAHVDRPMWFIDEDAAQKLEIARGDNVRFSVHAGGSK